MKTLFAISVFVFILGCKDGGPNPTPTPTPNPGPEVPGRIFAVLDDGSKLAIDNHSSLPAARAMELVVMADRSTQTDCVTQKKKGLIKTGDRIFLNDHYIAWFDMTTLDGVNFQEPPYGGDWERAGEWSGFWTLANGDFKYKVTGPSRCEGWAPNELVPGSASPRGEQHWWDRYSPPVEHTLLVRSTGKPSESYFLSFHYSKFKAPGMWKQEADAAKTTAGVHYRFSGRMAMPSSPAGATFATDIFDGDDSTVTNYIESEIEYVCRDQDVLSYWKVRPSANVVSDLSYVYAWVAFGQDVDDDVTPQTAPYCDQGKVAGVGGSQWPNQVYSQSLWTVSSQNLITSWNNKTFPAGRPVEMELGPGCPKIPYSNNDVYATELDVGDYLRWGEDRNLTANRRRMQMLLIGKGDSGDGSYAAPKQIPVNILVYADENRDGVIGSGALNRGTPYQLEAGKWYSMDFSFMTKF